MLRKFASVIVQLSIEFPLYSLNEICVQKKKNKKKPTINWFKKVFCLSSGLLPRHYVCVLGTPYAHLFCNLHKHYFLVVIPIKSLFCLPEQLSQNNSNIQTTRLMLFLINAMDYPKDAWLRRLSSKVAFWVCLHGPWPLQAVCLSQEQVCLSQVCQVLCFLLKQYRGFEEMKCGFHPAVCKGKTAAITSSGPGIFSVTGDFIPVLHHESERAWFPHWDLPTNSSLDR